MKKRDYFKNIDRSVLKNLKKILSTLEKQKNERRPYPLELQVYFDLKKIFPDMLRRPFLQGANEYSFINEMDCISFIAIIDNVSRYLLLTRGINDDLFNKLAVISEVALKSLEKDNDEKYYKDFRNLSAEKYESSVEESSQLSSALKEFLICLKDSGVNIRNYVASHPKEDKSTLDIGIVFSLSDKNGYDEKMFLMSKAFEYGMKIAIVLSKDDLGFSIMTDKYKTNEQIEYLMSCLKEYRKDIELNSIVKYITEYMKDVYSNSSSYGSITFFKEEEYVGISEVTDKAGVDGIFTEIEVLSAYKNKNPQTLQEMPEVPKEMIVSNARDVARAALEIYKKGPGRLSIFIKKILDTVNDMIRPGRGFGD